MIIVDILSGLHRVCQNRVFQALCCASVLRDFKMKLLISLIRYLSMDSKSLPLLIWRFHPDHNLKRERPPCRPLCSLSCMPSDYASITVVSFLQIPSMDPLLFTEGTSLLTKCRPQPLCAYLVAERRPVPVYAVSKTTSLTDAFC